MYCSVFNHLSNQVSDSLWSKSCTAKVTEMTIIMSFILNINFNFQLLTCKSHPVLQKVLSFNIYSFIHGNSVTLFFCLVCAVMRSLNSPQDYWQVDRVSTELKIHKLQEELDRVTLENGRLLERSGVSESGKTELKRQERITDKGGRAGGNKIRGAGESSTDKQQTPREMWHNYKRGNGTEERCFGTARWGDIQRRLEEKLNLKRGRAWCAEA